MSSSEDHPDVTTARFMCLPVRHSFRRHTDCHLGAVSQMHSMQYRVADMFWTDLQRC